MGCNLMSTDNETYVTGSATAPALLRPTHLTGLTSRLRAFSLIELLVVVVILAILMGLLLPTMVSAREYARRSVCTSNMRQIGAAIQMYAQINGGAAPLEPNMGNTLWSGRRMSIGYLYPYLNNNVDVFFCPSQLSFKIDDPVSGKQSFDVTGKVCRGTYAVRGALQFTDVTLGATVGIDRHTTSVCLTDLEAPEVDPTRMAHKDGLNALKMDGAVCWLQGESKKASETYQEYWDRLDSK